MTDIYDIKDTFLGLPIDITLSLMFIAFIIILILLYRYLIIKKTPKVSKEADNFIIKLKISIDYSKLLTEIEEKYLDDNKEVFYSKVSWIIRWILEEREYLSISNMTFEEISALELDLDIKKLIKNIYFKEYMKEVDDNKEIRKIIINKIRKLI